MLVQRGWRAALVSAMRLAKSEGALVEASPEKAATCRMCGSIVIAKCGEQRVWHWSHISRRECDSWSEPETPWHRSWKQHFPDDAQEVVCRDESGNNHRADVKTQAGLVIEFQRSPIAPDVQRKREAFYGDRLIWVLDGSRLKGDIPRFDKGSRNLVEMVRGRLTVFFTRNPAASFSRQWLESKAPVFLDYGGPDCREGGLWCLLPGRAEECAVVVALSRSDFLGAALTTPSIFDHAGIFQAVAENLRARNRPTTASLPQLAHWSNRRTPRRL